MQESVYGSGREGLASEGWEGSCVTPANFQQAGAKATEDGDKPSQRQQKEEIMA